MKESIFQDQRAIRLDSFIVMNCHVIHIIYISINTSFRMYCEIGLEILIVLGGTRTVNTDFKIIS